MNFEESVTYLYSLGNEVTAMKLGLDNPQKLLGALGYPQEKFKKVQVAGTNGKGSVCAFLDSICRNAQISAGLYTSPHLVSITERIRINGHTIKEDDFAKFAAIVREVTEREGLYATFFEQMTAIALIAFAENSVDLAILETGLGGRLDATTATNAEIVAITPIDRDHQQYLGNTLTEIAGEKAAIINSSAQTVVISNQIPEAEKVIVERCRRYGIEPIRTDIDLPNVVLSLRGRFQIENAKVAVRLAEILGIERSDIIRGLETTLHKGRMEYYGGILFDGAHNIAGAKALRDFIDEFHQNESLTLVFGAMKDKQIAEIAEILFPIAENLVLTQPDNSRSASIEELKEIAAAYIDGTKVFDSPDVSDAISRARQLSTGTQPGKRSLICVTGSLYLIGEAQRGMPR